MNDEHIPLAGPLGLDESSRNMPLGPPHLAFPHEALCLESRLHSARLCLVTAY